jgi:hypothetical protein
MKLCKKISAVFLSFALLATLLPLPAFSALAAGPTEVSSAAGLIAAAAAGGDIKLLNDINCTDIYAGSSCTIDADGHTLAVTFSGPAGISVNGGANLTLKNGTFDIKASTPIGTGVKYGIWSNGGNTSGVTLEKADVEIHDISTGTGINSFANGKPFTMTGGKLHIYDCATAIRWGNGAPDGGVYKGAMTFNSGVVDIENCGSSFTNFYTGNDVVFGDGGNDPLTVTVKMIPSGAVENTLQLTQIAGLNNTVCTVKSNADVKLVITGTAGERRGINSSGAKVDIKGGTLEISSEYTGTGDTFGLRGINAIVEKGGTLKISGVKYGVAPRGSDGSLTAQAGSLVTSDGVMDCTAPSVITGGSVLMDDAVRVVGGKIDTYRTSSQVSPTPVNAAGESLTRFDLTGKANSDIQVAADPADTTNHPAYTYSVGADHSGTAYVWAPQVKVTFSSDVNNTVVYKVDSTIRGNTISFVGGSAPAASDIQAPEGTKFLYWINAKTGKIFNPDTEAVSEDINVYAVFSAVSSLNIPIDILEDTGGTGTFVNGPQNAFPGDTINYKMTIDMADIARIAGSFSSVKGYITGSYTMTVSADAGLKPNANYSKSTDINDYFSGDAVKLFEMTAAPVFDSAANTITYQAKVRDEYVTNGITGAELAGLLNSGLYAISKADDNAVVTDSAVAQGYTRAKITFAGNINFSNSSFSRNFTINMTGTQADPANLSDPTLGTYGTDPAGTVSATVLVKARQYKVNYAFVSGTNNMTLPEEVLKLLPASASADDKTTVTAVQPSSVSVTVPGGTWTFSGYDASAKTISGADVTFTGTWVFSESQTPVSPKTGDAGRTLPYAAAAAAGFGIAAMFFISKRKAGFGKSGK